jgi:sugar phosphate isomerase/epimerase
MDRETGIRYTGFADEAAPDIDGQIAATKALGWSHIEVRNVNGVNMTDLGEAEFEAVEAKLASSGIAVSCFGSAVANWGKDPFVPEDYGKSLSELGRALVRMNRLGVGYLRGMSFGIRRDLDPEDPEWFGMVVAKVRELVRFCEEAGVVYLHENCMNYGGMSWEHTMRLLEAIDSPSFRLVFDTGNPPMSPDRRGARPWALQSSWDFYRNVRDFVDYVHVKDCVWMAETDGIFPRADFTWPGEGRGEVRPILSDLVSRGYSGFLSIEPHREVVFHEGEAPGRAARLDAYVEYGRRLEAMVAGLQGS